VTDLLQLQDDSPPHESWRGEEPEPTKQGVLFAGLNCLAGQLDLFETDGTPLPKETDDERNLP